MKMFNMRFRSVMASVVAVGLVLLVGCKSVERHSAHVVDDVGGVCGSSNMGGIPLSARYAATTMTNMVFAACASSLYSMSDSYGYCDGLEALATLPPWEDMGSGDEIWVIEKAPVSSSGGGERPGQGELKAEVAGEEIPLPLKHTAVDAHVSGFIATVNVVQQYHNPYDVKIEAVYVFPLPQTAAVTDFLMIVGDRRIRGLVREKEEAQRLYNEAKSQGYRAALMTQERPNIFTQSVANIEPGKDIDVQITYLNPLTYRDGEFEFVFPMVVGPRFNPPGSTDGVGAVAQGARGVSGQPTEVEYLRPGTRSGHDISLSVEIDAGVSVGKVYSRTHAVRKERLGADRLCVTLSENDAIPNRDFVLRYQTAGSALKTAMLLDRGDRGNTFALLLNPPANASSVPRMPREMVFVLDCSGSMSGQPIARAKQAMKRCLRNLDRHDTFQIIRFSDAASTFGRSPVPATPENVEKALAYVDQLEGSGGTMMIEGIKAALEFPHDEDRLRVVSFMTDGYIGNEAEILAAIEQRVGESRIFSFGVGSSVNRYLLERMASMGRGAAAFIGLDGDAGEEVDLFYERLAHPVLANIRIDWGSMAVRDVYPREIPDLFVGRPVLVTGRLDGEGENTIRISGDTGDGPRVHAIDVDLSSAEASHPGITKMWARWKIKDLSEEEISSPTQELKEEIIRTSIEHNLLSRYTSFLAVDASERTEGDHGISVNVPVNVPDGVRYETTVQEL